MSTAITRLARVSGLVASFLALLVVLSACFEASNAVSAPPVWKNQRTQLFSIDYMNNWNISTKDLYLGASSPQLEMLQGTLFTSVEDPVASLHVLYAARPNNTVSSRDLMLKFFLGSSQHPLQASSLSTITLNGERWYQGSIEKQVKQSDGSTLAAKETVLGINHSISTNKTELYFIIYQDATSSYAKTSHDYFERMVKSFRFSS
ncbi:hypothetical protein [Ktedonobacter robiniae]|uniref:PsbP C-terminal domain-containing protein n=1 Tax=Ktedonobacter robiniae TaxID=2778365 RepID=A0ABQ3V7P3_9CHLR|nr:hypothetical protein [Ktedonobacter robiniae]GHO60952.1 hypothetical protein KSB_94270 [Ktedonobacter robiniae]